MAQLFWPKMAQLWWPLTVNALGDCRIKEKFYCGNGKLGAFFRSLSLCSPTMRLKRSKKRAQFPTYLATIPLTEQPPSNVRNSLNIRTDFEPNIMIKFLTIAVNYW